MRLIDPNRHANYFLIVIKIKNCRDKIVYFAIRKDP
jgi:hypothetical protein